MDADMDSPSPKRQRTLSHGSSTSSSRNSSPARLAASPSPNASPNSGNLDLPLRRANSARSREPAKRREYSNSLSREGSAAPNDSDDEAHTYWRGKTPPRTERRRLRRGRNSADSTSRSVSPNSSSRTSTIESRDHSPHLPSRLKPLRFKPFLTIPKAHARGITCLKFSPDGQLLATSSADATINIYTVSSLLASASTDTVEVHPIKTLTGHLAGINALSWSPSYPPYILASASDDKSILLWSPSPSGPSTPLPPSPLLGHHNYVTTLSFSPKGNMLVSGSYDEAVFLWDVRAGRIMRSLPAHSDPVGGVDFLARDGTMVVSCAGDGLIRIWDASTGQCLKTLVDEARRPVTSVRFSPNGRFVLAWTLDGCVRLWDYVAGACVKTYQGHVNRSYGLGGTMGSYGAASRNGTGNGNGSGRSGSRDKQEAFVVSGSEDGQVVVWDVTSKDVSWRGSGHRKPVLGVDFCRLADDGRGLLVSGGLDRDIRVWIEDESDDADAGSQQEQPAQQRQQQHDELEQEEEDGKRSWRRGGENGSGNAQSSAPRPGMHRDDDEDDEDRFEDAPEKQSAAEEDEEDDGEDEDEDEDEGEMRDS